MTRPAPPARIGIVGVGLIGGSIAHGLRAAWPGTTVVGVDLPDVLERARVANAIDDGAVSVAGLRGADFVVLATPIARLIDLLPEVGRLGADVVVTDVGSTKRDITRAAAEAGVARFVGGHPVAGAEHGGFARARADLFRGRSWILVPSSTADRAAEDSVEMLVRALGASPVRMDAGTHDRVMAYVSHVPQILGSALMVRAGRALGDAGLAVAGRTFHEMTRVASSPTDIWSDILRTNADCIAAALDELGASLPAREPDLRDSGRTGTLFDDARAWRERLVAVAAGES